MSAPTTRTEFANYCLRRLGHPVITVNVDEDQVDDRIDDALEYFQDYHFDGVEKAFVRHQITQADIDRRYIKIPPHITFVVGLFPFDQSSASINMFDLRYQLRLHDLYDFTSVSYVSYEITMQHLRTLNLLFSGTPQMRFNQHGNKLYIDQDWTRDIHLGDYVIVECYRTMEPEVINITGTLNTLTTSNVVVGTGTSFDAQLIPGDEIVVGSDTKRILRIDSSTSMNVDSNFATANSAATALIVGTSSVWNNRFLKQYATALIKRQWGENMGKFSGTQMPGGVTLNGLEIQMAAQAEIDKIEEKMQNDYGAPMDILIG